jgi:large conductance mechanosensitive channel
MSVVKEFKEFAMKGNVVDLAVGVIIGAAFGKIVTVLVEKIIMPPIGLVIGGMDFSQLKVVLKTADAAGKGEVAIWYGELVQTSINFLIVAIALFMIIKGMNSMKKAADPVSPDDVILLREIRDLLKK